LPLSEALFASLSCADVSHGQPQQPLHRRVQGRMGRRGTTANSIVFHPTKFGVETFNCDVSALGRDSIFLCVVAITGDLRLHRHQLLRRRRHVSSCCCSSPPSVLCFPVS
jgi:hypothetical protein